MENLERIGVKKGETRLTILQGSVESTAIWGRIQRESVNCVITSPPYYGLRDYGVNGQLGQESHPDEYVRRLVNVFRDVKQVLRPDGVVWLNLGDSHAANRGGTHQPAETLAGGVGGYTTNNSPVNRGRLHGYNPTRDAPSIGLKHKDLIGMPWRVAFALQADGWYLRSDVVWHKPNPLPESVKDRPTRAHEYVFLLSKRDKYYFDAPAIAEPAVSKKNKWTDGGSEKQRGHGRRHAGFNGRYAERIEKFGAPKTRNARDVWTISPKGFKGAHFAVFPEELVRRCLLSGCPVGGTVLDPFVGSGTTLKVASDLGRNGIGIELNPEYCALAASRSGAEIDVVTGEVVMEEAVA